MITKTIKIEELGYDEDVVEGCNGASHKIRNGAVYDPYYKEYPCEERIREQMEYLR